MSRRESESYRRRPPEKGGRLVPLGLVLLCVGAVLPSTQGVGARFSTPGGPTGSAVSSIYVTLVGPKGVTLGSTATFEANATGGVAPYEFQWTFNGSSTAWTPNRNFTVRPLTDGIFLVNVTARDSTSQNISAVLTFSTTGPDPVSVLLSVTATGTAVVFVAHVNGGTPPYSYEWIGPGAPSGWTTSANWTDRSVPLGTSRVTVVVRDSDSYSASNTLTVVNHASESTPWYQAVVEPLIAVMIGFAVALGAIYLVARHRRRRRPPSDSGHE